jgi:protease I
MQKQNLCGVRVAILTMPYVDEDGLSSVRHELENAGAQTLVISPKSSEQPGMQQGQVDVDVALEAANPEEFDALLIPGDAMNADALRTNPNARQFVQRMDESGSPIGVIGYGAWLLVSAGLAQGRKIATPYSIHDDLQNAGAEVSTQDIVCDGNLLSTRQTTNIPMFNRELNKLISVHRQRVQGQTNWPVGALVHERTATCPTNGHPKLALRQKGAKVLTMSSQLNLSTARVAIVVADCVEESELLQPLQSLTEVGAEVVVISPKGGEIQAMRNQQKSRRIKADLALCDADPNDFDAVIIPGGILNLNALRSDQDARIFVQAMNKSGCPIGVIAHGTWLLISAGIAQGRKLACSPTIQDDLLNAGGEDISYQGVGRDGNLLSISHPTNISQFNREMKHLLFERLRKTSKLDESWPVGALITFRTAA